MRMIAEHLGVPSVNRPWMISPQVHLRRWVQLQARPIHPHRVQEQNPLYSGAFG